MGTQSREPGERDQIPRLICGRRKERRQENQGSMTLLWLHSGLFSVVFIFLTKCQIHRRKD